MSITQEIASMWLERAGGGSPDATRSGAPGTPSALPCQYSNNCPDSRGSTGEKQAETKGYKLSPKGEDRNGRFWKKDDEAEQWERITGNLDSAERKRAFALRSNAEGFTNHYGRERCGFLTLTAKNKDMTPKEFGEIWHEMRKHGLLWLRSYIRVLEPQKRGAPHYHLMVAVDFDMMPDSFDWNALFGAAGAYGRGDLVQARALTRQYAESAADSLRECWAELRSLCEQYGLGRSEFLPFRKGGGQLANYVGKYLEAGLIFKRDEWKGARRVEYDRIESKKWKGCASSFAWASPGAQVWRERVGEWAEACAAADFADLKRVGGPKWAYFLRTSIMSMNEWEWRQYLAVVALRSGGWLKDKPVLVSATGETYGQWPNLDETLTLMRGGGLGEESSPSGGAVSPETLEGLD